MQERYFILKWTSIVYEFTSEYVHEIDIDLFFLIQFINNLQISICMVAFSSLTCKFLKTESLLVLYSQVPE